MPTVDAAVELPLLAARLKAAGMTGIRAEMVKALRDAAKPMIPELRSAAEAKLPRAGGLNEAVAKQPITVSVRTGVATAGVSIRARWTRTNRGSWRHPVFGHDRWVTQTNSTAEGWFDKTAQRNTAKVRAEMEKVLLAVAAQVNGLGLQVAWIRVGRYWKARGLGWRVNYTTRLDGSWVEMERASDYWRLTERGAKRLVRRLEAGGVAGG